MFTLDFSRSSELESLLRAGIGFHLWHNALLINPDRTFDWGGKSSVFSGILEKDGSSEIGEGRMEHRG